MCLSSTADVFLGLPVQRLLFNPPVNSPPVKPAMNPKWSKQGVCFGLISIFMFPLTGNIQTSCWNCQCVNFDTSAFPGTHSWTNTSIQQFDHTVRHDHCCDSAVNRIQIYGHLKMYRQQQPWGQFNVRMEGCDSFRFQTYWEFKALLYIDTNIFHLIFAPANIKFAVSLCVCVCVCVPCSMTCQPPPSLQMVECFRWNTPWRP